MRYCKEKKIKIQPARFPASLPKYFIRMVTNRGDVVLDPFGGSCVTVEVPERFGRHWTCVESKENYLKGAKGRFCN
ncbi:MAG: DNA methyltransferase, partial [Candidatus Puniceispirillaceae bacterium]